jgi:DNA-binding transcriptional LysR family regulator
MHDVNLRSVDLNLLPVFEAVYEERSLSRAAVRLSMTQPAVSHALARLRIVFKDELFLRHPRGVTATAVADAIYQRMDEALGLVRAAVADRRGFDPRTSERRFFVAIPHPLGPMLAVRLLERLKGSAPGVSVGFSTRSRPIDLERNLLDGRFDIAVDWLPTSKDGLEDEVLFEDELVPVVRKDHPAIGMAQSRKALVSGWEFVILRPRVESVEHPLEAVKAWARLKPKVVLEVSEFLEVLAVLGRTDFVGLVPVSLATAARSQLGVELIPGLPRSERFPVRMIWRASRGIDPALQFLRKEVSLAVRGTLSG